MHARQTKRFNYSREWLVHVLAAYTVNPAAALLDTAVVGLWADDSFAPTNLSTKADFDTHKATFTDYVKKAYVPTGPRSIQGRGLAYGKVVEWIMTTDPVVTGNRIRGYWIEDATRVVGYETFAAGDRIDMVNLGDSLILEALLPLPYLFDITGDIIEA